MRVAIEHGLHARVADDRPARTWCVRQDQRLTAGPAHVPISIPTPCRRCGSTRTSRDLRAAATSREYDPELKVPATN